MRFYSNVILFWFIIQYINVAYSIYIDKDYTKDTILLL